MDIKTINKLAFCEAFDEIFGCDSFLQMQCVTEDNGTYDEWQAAVRGENDELMVEIERRKGLIIKYFEGLG